MATRKNRKPETRVNNATPADVVTEVTAPVDAKPLTHVARCGLESATAHEALKAAHSELAKVKAQPKPDPQDLAIAKSAVESAQVDVDRAKANRDRAPVYDQVEKILAMDAGSRSRTDRRHLLDTRDRMKSALDSQSHLTSAEHDLLERMNRALS